MIALRVASRSPPVDRSITVSACQRCAQRSFSTSSSVPLLTGDAPMFALTLVRLALPMHIGSSPQARWLMLAGITMRPAATSFRTASGERCGSRSATRRICGVTVPSRACSSWVAGTKPSGASQRLPSRVQSAGMKSQAVLSDGAGMPGVSGELNVSGPPIWLWFAKLPGVVPSPREDGLSPTGGSW